MRTTVGLAAHLRQHGIDGDHAGRDHAVRQETLIGDGSRAAVGPQAVAVVLRSQGPQGMRGGGAQQSAPASSGQREPSGAVQARPAWEPPWEPGARSGLGVGVHRGGASARPRPRFFCPGFAAGRARPGPSRHARRVCCAPRRPRGSAAGILRGSPPSCCAHPRPPCIHSMGPPLPCIGTIRLRYGLASTLHHTAHVTPSYITPRHSPIPPAPAPPACP
jgi:hypothetical protein